MIRIAFAIIGDVAQRILAGSDAALDPPAYRERLACMASDAARSRSRAGLWLLQQLLTSAAFPANAMHRIDFGPYGQPRIDGAPAFSISHSQSLVACALRDDGAIGLDVEYRRTRDTTRLARLLDTPEQHQVAEQPQMFFDYWCAREATVKASGRVGLKRIRALQIAGDTARLDARDWSLRPLNLVDGYAACLASDREIGPADAIESHDLSDWLAGNP